MAEQMDMELTSWQQACQHSYTYGTLTENQLETSRKPLIPTKLQERSPHCQVECGINKDQNGSDGSLLTTLFVTNLHHVGLLVWAALGADP